MSKWYKSALVKGILIFLSVLSAITALLSLVIISTYSVSVKEIWNKKPTEYTDSKEFENQMCRATMDVLGQISYEDIFETDGKYNPDKLIDIMQYGYNGRHYDEETERLRYKLSDLQKWSEEYQNNYATQENPIVVCQKADKTYHYYYWDEFLSLLKKKTLTVDIDGYTSDEIVNALASGNVSLSQFAGHDILDEKGETVYRDFWGFSGAIEEEARPDGGNNILDVVNQTPQLNGKLSEVYAQLGSILSNLYYDFQSYQNSAEWTEGNTNFAYIFVDKETKKVYTNRKEYQDYNSVKENISDIQKNAKYMIVQPKLSDFKTNMDITANDWKEFVKSQRRNSNGDFIFAAAVDTRFSIQDSFYLDKKLYDEYAPYINRAVILLGAAVLLIIVSLIWLTVIAGRNNRSDGVHLNVFDRWKTELAAVFVIGIWIIPMMFWMNNGNMALGYFAESTDLMTATIGYSYEYASGYVPTMQDMIQLACTAAYTMIMFLVGYLSLVRRIKAGTMWKNSVLYAFCRFFRIFWRNRNVVWRMVVSGVILIGIHWMLALFRTPGFVLITLAADAFIVYYLVLNAIAKNKIIKGIKAVAGGDLEYQISLEHLRGEQREVAEMLNDIGTGLQKAVEKSVKSERLKTDLITNVSHDIKTPLTSIINYVNLMKLEKIDNERVQGYIQILDEKSQRLRQLTADLVEASKISSGNVKLDMQVIDLVELVYQTSGEFNEKFEQKELTIVTKLPKTAVLIRADGRQLYRVIENLYNNVAKYALEKTRVYVDISYVEEKVVFSIKNVSEHSLARENSNAGDLTERFIRGDSSRTTEGSGLGLSIAKSLTVLMGGVFDIKVDGDLFKASITFPQYVDENSSNPKMEEPASEDDYEIEELEPEERTEKE